MGKLTFGLEQEFFVKQGENYVLAAPLAADACGYLAEARGEPSDDPIQTKHNLLVAVEKLQEEAAKGKKTLECAFTAELPKEFLRVARRTFGKGPAHSYFVSEKVYVSDKPRAGLHVHFGSTETINYTEHVENSERGIERKREVPVMINIPRIIFMLDKAFKDEIKEAKRVPGEYELKAHGFEYRSLPTTANLDKVVTTLRAIAKEPHLWY